MRIVLFMIFLLTASYGFSQKFENLSLIKASVQHVKEVEATHIEVPQFLDNCIYDQKCGVFLSSSFKKFGFLKGTFLSIDRRLRCNGLSKSQASPSRFNEQGLLKDYAEDYRF